MSDHCDNISSQLLLWPNTMTRHFKIIIIVPGTVSTVVHFFLHVLLFEFNIYCTVQRLKCFHITLFAFTSGSNSQCLPVELCITITANKFTKDTSNGFGIIILCSNLSANTAQQSKNGIQDFRDLRILGFQDLILTYHFSSYKSRIQINAWS